MKRTQWTVLMMGIALFASTAQSAQKIYRAEDYEQIKDQVTLSRQAQEKVKANLCVGPAIAAWVDAQIKRAAEQGDEALELAVVRIDYYPQPSVIQILDAAGNNARVKLVGAAECGATEVSWID